MNDRVQMKYIIILFIRYKNNDKVKILMLSKNIEPHT